VRASVFTGWICDLAVPCCGRGFIVVPVGRKCGRQLQAELVAQEAGLAIPLGVGGRTPPTTTMAGVPLGTRVGAALFSARLSELLIRRDQRGATWAEHISHGLPDVGHLTVELMVAEAAPSDCWPRLAAQ